MEKKFGRLACRASIQVMEKVEDGVERKIK
jgi:hypothetical protein